MPQNVITPPLSEGAGGSPLIEIRSEEVQEILSKRPPAALRWGSLVFLSILLLMLALSWWVKYPDLVKAPLRLTSLNAPKSVHTKMAGKLVRLLAAENQTVRQGDALAYLESTANHAEVLGLASRLDTIFADLRSPLFRRGVGEAANLGELQPAFQTFRAAYVQYLSFLSDGFHLRKKALLQKELSGLKRLENNLHGQKSLQQQDLGLSEAEFQTQRKLAQEKIIAPMEFKREESKHLGKKMPLQQTEAAIISNLSAQTAKQKEILELDKTIGEQSGVFMQALNTFRSAVNEWKMKYVLAAPTDGKVYFSSFVQENQTLAAGQEVFFVAQANRKEFGEVYVPQYNFGKVKQGQRVLVKFNGYPYQEFGMVEGRVDFISEIPIRDSVFLARISLPKGLATNYGKKLTYRTGMTATAEIVTEDMRLPERLFYNFRRAATR